MSEQESPRSIPRHTVVPTDAGSFTLPAPDAPMNADESKPAKPAKTPKAGESADA